MCPKSNLQKETKIHFTMQTCNILQPFIVLCKQKSRRDPCVRIRPRPERHKWTRQSPWPSPASVIRQPFLTGHRILHHLADGICRCHHTALVPLSHQDSGLEVLAYELRDQRQVGVHCPAGEDGLPVAQVLHGHKRRGGTVRHELLLGCPLGVVTMGGVRLGSVGHGPPQILKKTIILTL
jgi:hypothetical protein